MASGDKYLPLDGVIQKFPDKPLTVERDVNGKTVIEFTIAVAPKGALCRVSVWPEIELPEFSAGDFCRVYGKFTTSGDNNQFNNISAYYLRIDPALPRGEREVVNQQSSSGGSEDSPF